MKSYAPIVLAILVALNCQSCNGKRPSLSKEGEIISKLQHDKTQPEYVREGAGIMLDVLEEKGNVSNRAYLDAKWKVSSVRSAATVQAWIALLHSTEKKLPDSLPSAEEIDREKKEWFNKHTDTLYFSPAVRLVFIKSCISALTSLDMPEAKSEVEALLQRFEKKYGKSSGGKKMLDLYKIEKSQQEEMVRLGTAPWQVGPNPSRGLE